MEYIHHYTLMTGHMRKSYSNEVEKEIRIRVRELIKFERGISFDILPRLKPWDSLNFLTGSPLSKGSDIAVVFRIQTYRRSHVVWYLPGLWSDAGPHIILMLKTETLFH